jgi:hypothetical protein
VVKKADKQAKAVEKIKKSVQKAVDKGVSAAAVSAAVEDTIAYSTDNTPGESEVNAPATAKAAKMPGRNKPTDITLKRGVMAPLKKGSGKTVLNTEPLQPGSEKASLKKLPGKRKPPTLALKRAKNS